MCIDPRDIDPETGRPYAGYSSPALDDEFHRHEMDVDDEPGEAGNQEIDAARVAELVAGAPRHHEPPTIGGTMPPNPEPNPELERLLAIARDYRPSDQEAPRIEAGAVHIPFDVRRTDGGWTIEWEIVRNRAELLEALGL